MPSRLVKASTRQPRGRGRAPQPPIAPSPVFTLPKRVWTPEIGEHVWTGDELGIGRVRAVDEPHCQVELFHSITVREERLFRTSELTPYTLASQTRVYVRIDAGEWLMGRVSAHDRASGKLAYEIRFPNGQRAVVPATDVHARSLLPKLDPTDVLAASGIETQFFSDRRRAAIEAIVRARAASRGLTGLLSAAVELVPHQLEVIRRVLEDPTQRYLLADEVGMGKTIEAGIIIRQCLLDVPASRVLVLVPEQLVHQWQRELIQKFGVRDFTSPEWGTDEEDEDDLAEARVQVLPFEALPSLMSAAGAARGRGGYDLVVVDEAHHLVADQQGTLAPAFGLMQQLAQASRRLLLLSATPILGNERAMLALLNLLDPLSNPIDDLDGFKRKIAWREQLGEIQAALSPTAPSFALRRITARLREELPDDPAIPALADQLADAGNLSADEKAAAVRAIKLHLAETYRLHQRLLRTRRKDTAGWELLPRQGRIVVEPDLDDRAFEIADALENWRFEAHRATLNAIEAGTADAGSYERQLAQRYVALFEAFGRGADELARELEMQIAGVAARTLPTFSEDQLAMEGLAEALAGDNESSSRAEFVAETVRLMLKALTVPTPRIVAFGSSAADVQTIHAYLADPRRVWSYDVFAVLEGMSPEAIEAGVDRFRASARPAVILCDRAGEEGLNFQFADAILHLDLPLSPQRLEQRIGRLDRFGRTADAIRHRVMLPSNEDDLPWQAWLDVVQQGFGLFDASMSEVQFLLALLTEQVELALFRGGAPGLREKLDPIRDQLEQERKRLDYQHALDQYEMGDDDAGQLFTQFDEAEGDEHAFAIALNDWMLHVLQLDRSRADQDNRFKLHWSRSTLLPTDYWQTFFEAGLGRPVTYRRALATRSPGTALLRPGFCLVDTIERHLRWDDRGTAFATWRVDPRWNVRERGEWVGLRLTYVIEANMEVLQAQLGETLDERLLPNIRRRADSYLAPWVETLHVHESFEAVNDPLALDILSRRYESEDDLRGQQQTDFNLGSRRDALFSLRPPDGFAELCRRARDHSEQLLRSSERFQSQLAAANARARLDLADRSERLRRRDAALRAETANGDPQIAHEIAANEAILATISSPSVRLDAIGLFVIADYGPHALLMEV